MIIREHKGNAFALLFFLPTTSPISALLRSFNGVTAEILLRYSGIFIGQGGAGGNFPYLCPCIYVKKEMPMR